MARPPKRVAEDGTCGGASSVSRQPPLLPVPSPPVSLVGLCNAHAQSRRPSHRVSCTPQHNHMYTGALPIGATKTTKPFPTHILLELPQPRHMLIVLLNLPQTQHAEIIRRTARRKSKPWILNPIDSDYHQLRPTADCTLSVHKAPHPVRQSILITLICKNPTVLYKHREGWD